MIQYTRELVLKKVRETFPDIDETLIFSLLDLYGMTSYEQERERVQLAILKLSEGDLKKLERNLDVAKQDFRDALSWAEYPAEGQLGFGADWQKLAAAREQDKKQYLEWLFGQA